MLDDHDNVAMREAAVVSAGFSPDGAEAALAALLDTDPRLRARGVSAARRLGVLDVERRVGALRDEDPLVRRVAAQLEARHPDADVAVTEALRVALDDPDELVVVAACEALGELGGAGVVEALCTVAAGHADARCREAGVAALGARGDVEGLPAVLAALTDRPAIRRRAVVALAAFEGPAVEDALAGALGDRDWQVRQAAEALLAEGPRP